jgi:hypothetical protein
LSDNSRNSSWPVTLKPDAARRRCGRRLLFAIATLASAFPLLAAASRLWAAESTNAFPPDPQQALERTMFQTGSPWNGMGNLRSDVAIVYGIDSRLAERAQSWRDRGYRVHVMTGVAWGAYQDYLYGRFDGTNREDEVQTVRDGKKVGHGGDVYYMCPTTNYGKYLCAGVQRALDAGVDAIHLEEPEFWVNAGYSPAFKREWKDQYGTDWQAPDSSIDAQWRASKLKYYLYRRTLQQVFDYIQDYNRRAGRNVRCYVATHSLLSYAQIRIVSPESSLSRLNGCDGYIAQVWTGTARAPNFYRGKSRERTFEAAFLEYGAMQNLVRATGRTVWFLNDPVEDSPEHDWSDYQANWESTLVASLFQPQVWRYEVAPWPERVFGGRYPARGDAAKAMPPGYATEVQTVANALNDMNQARVEWECGTTGVGVFVSDSLMFERGEPSPSDPNLGHIYGLALPLLKRGMPITPVQLENAVLPRYLDGFRLLLLTYRGMKPLDGAAHKAIAEWVKRGGVLVVVDDDGDPYNRVREWWNSSGNRYATPREHLFEQLGLPGDLAEAGKKGTFLPCGKGGVVWMKDDPARLAADPGGDERLIATLKQPAVRSRVGWQEANYLMVRRGPYLIAAGLDESIPGDPKEIHARVVNLFDPALRVQKDIRLTPGARCFLLDLDSISSPEPKVLASACKTLVKAKSDHSLTLTIEGVVATPGIILVRVPIAPRAVTLDGKPLKDYEHSAADQLLWIRFQNEARPRELTIEF